MPTPTAKERAQAIVDRRHRVASLPQWVDEHLPIEIEAQIREAVAEERAALAQSIKEMLGSALRQLGVVSAAGRDDPHRWSGSDLATDLEPLLASAILGRGQKTKARSKRSL